MERWAVPDGSRQIKELDGAGTTGDGQIEILFGKGKSP